MARSYALSERHSECPLYGPPFTARLSGSATVQRVTPSAQWDRPGARGAAAGAEHRRHAVAGRGRWPTTPARRTRPVYGRALGPLIDLLLGGGQSEVSPAGAASVSRRGEPPRPKEAARKPSLAQRTSVLTPLAEPQLA